MPLLRFDTTPSLSTVEKTSLAETVAELSTTDEGKRPLRSQNGMGSPGFEPQSFRSLRSLHSLLRIDVHRK